MRPIHASATAALLLTGCLEPPKFDRLPSPPTAPTAAPTDLPAVPAGPVSETPYSPYFCPTGASYDFSTRFCVREGAALGPFTKAMTAQCKKAHSPAVCDAKDWPAAVAGSLRGTGACPAGANELGNGFCAEENEVYGPFAKERVEVCRREGGGDPCEWNRWSITFADATRKVETGPVVNPPAPPTGVDFSEYLLGAMNDILGQDSGRGYSMRAAGQHSRNLSYAGQSIFEVGDRTSHCVGMTFQTFVVALNKWHSEKGDAKAWNMPVSSMKWSPFKECWYVNAGCHGARDAIVRYGIGTPVKEFSDLRPGDFVNYDRTNGYGHSVMFLKFITAQDASSTPWQSGAIGFEYFSSQGSTKGAGKMRAYFDGSCHDSHPNSDCGLIKSSLVMGRISWPSSFTAPRSSLALSGDRPSTPPGTVPGRLEFVSQKR